MRLGSHDSLSSLKLELGAKCVRNSPIWKNLKKSRVPCLILSSSLVGLLFNSFSIEENDLSNTTANNERDGVVARVVGDLHCPAVYVSYVSPTGTLFIKLVSLERLEFKKSNETLELRKRRAYFANFDKVSSH